MATFTAIRNKKQTAGAMLGVLSYVAQGKKTMLDGACLVTGSNCVPQASYLEMMTTKQRFQKTNGRQFYHFVQSFSETDDLTPQEVNAIGLELAQRAFPGYEVVIATHVDTNHLHNHLVVNSVSCENGRKLHQNRDDFVFRKHDSQDPMTPSTFTWRFKLILKKNGLPEKLNVHSLRHSNASLLIANGADVATVAGLLGHSQPSTTLDIYTHAFDKNKKAASEALQRGLDI